MHGAKSHYSQMLFQLNISPPKKIKHYKTIYNMRTQTAETSARETVLKNGVPVSCNVVIHTVYSYVVETAMSSVGHTVRAATMLNK